MLTLKHDGLRVFTQINAFIEDDVKLQWCPDISPGPVQSDNGTIWGVGHKAVLLPLRCILLK